MSLVMVAVRRLFWARRDLCRSPSVASASDRHPDDGFATGASGAGRTGLLNAAQPLQFDQPGADRVAGVACVVLDLVGGRPCLRPWIGDSPGRQPSPSRRRVRSRWRRLCSSGFRCAAVASSSTSSYLWSPGISKLDDGNVPCVSLPKVSMLDGQESLRGEAIVKGCLREANERTKVRLLGLRAYFVRSHGAGGGLLRKILRSLAPVGGKGRRADDDPTPSPDHADTSHGDLRSDLLRKTSPGRGQIVPMSSGNPQKKQKSLTSTPSAS